KRAIYRVWPDFSMKLLIDRSVSTIKADAARRSFDAAGRDIVWCVIDSGIDENHPHFKTFDTLKGSVAGLHRDFTGDAQLDNSILAYKALIDENGHGTHIAGIIAGSLGRTDGKYPTDYLRVGQHIAVSEESALEDIEERRD